MNFASLTGTRTRFLMLSVAVVAMGAVMAFVVHDRATHAVMTQDRHASLQIVVDNAISASLMRAVAPVSDQLIIEEVVVPTTDAKASQQSNAGRNGRQTFRVRHTVIRRQSSWQDTQAVNQSAANTVVAQPVTVSL